MGILILPRILRLTLLIFLGMSAFFPVWAQGEDHLQLYEQKIKAGLIYNFLKYTTWPTGVLAGHDNQLHVCLFGSDPFDGYLAPLQGKTAQQSVIVITQILHVQDAGQCNMVFINSDQEAVLPELLKFLDGKHILTISDIKRFAEQGGMVELIKEDQKINLYINNDAVKQSGLDIQNRMLRLAKLVSG